MTTDVKPTRAEELKLKEQIDLAESGHSILEKKRDSLIHSFMELVGEAKDIQSQQTEAFNRAREELAKAIAFEGSDRLESVSMAINQTPQVELESRNLMGVKVPKIKSEQVRRKPHERGFSILSSTSRIDETISAYEELLEKVIEFAETETGLIKLLDEIDKTKRRVNALEEKVIPDMKQALNYVSQVLEETEREETFRMKKIKEKNEEEAAESRAETTATTCPECGKEFSSERGMHIHHGQVH